MAPAPGYTYNFSASEWICADGYLGTPASSCEPDFQCILRLLGVWQAIKDMWCVPRALESSYFIT